MTHTTIDIASLEALYQQAYKDWPGSIERIGIARRQFTDALLTAALELIKAVKERDAADDALNEAGQFQLTGAPPQSLASRIRDLNSDTIRLHREKCEKIDELFQAESALASLRALLAEAGEATGPIAGISGRYEKLTDHYPLWGARFHNGEKVSNQDFAERDIEPIVTIGDLRRIARLHASIQSTLREIPTSGAKPLDFP